MKKKPKAPPKPEQSFRRSLDGYHFRGRKLEPFSFLRQTALIPLSAEMGSSYASDVGIAIFLMMQPDGIVKQARQDPAAFIDRIDAFANDNGLGAIAGANFAEARKLFEEIRADILAATGIPDFGKNESEEQAEDESGND